MQAGMGITDDIIQGKISCFRNKFHKHKEKCSEKRKFLGALCLRSEMVPAGTIFFKKDMKRHEKLWILRGKYQFAKTSVLLYKRQRKNTIRKGGGMNQVLESTFRDSYMHIENLILVVYEKNIWKIYA